MDIGDWPSAREAGAAFKQIREFDLEANLAEFLTFGYTILTPDQIAAGDLVDRLREAVLRVASDRTGVTHTVDGTTDQGKLRTGITFPNQFVLFYLLTEDAAFRDAVCHPLLQPLLQMVLGPNYQSSSCAAFVKSKGDAYGPSFGIHTDSAQFPEPLPPIDKAHVVNTNWVLTDYAAENGPLCVVPGSHRERRHPRPSDAKHAVAVETSAGSVIVFHGSLWHGGMPKETDGLRLSVNCYYSRDYAKMQEDYRGVFSEDTLAAHGELFRQLVGEFDGFGWKSQEGPDPSKLLRMRL